jgi:hypothetical protein
VDVDEATDKKSGEEMDEATMEKLFEEGGTLTLTLALALGKTTIAILGMNVEEEEEEEDVDAEDISLDKATIRETRR